MKRTTGPTGITYFIYAGDKPIYEFDSAGGTPSINVYGRGIDEWSEWGHRDIDGQVREGSGRAERGRTSQILYRSNHGSGQYFEQDHEGSVIAVTGGTGIILESYRYDAFGAPTIYKQDGTVITTGASLINNRFLFTGREYAPQYGFYEYRARAYHPGIGRFMSEDPSLFVRGIGLGKSSNDWSFERLPAESELNLFRYVQNDPLNIGDPLGLAPEEPGSITLTSPWRPTGGPKFDWQEAGGEGITIADTIRARYVANAKVTCVCEGGNQVANGVRTTTRDLNLNIAAKTDMAGLPLKPPAPSSILQTIGEIIAGLVEKKMPKTPILNAQQKKDIANAVKGNTPEQDDIGKKWLKNQSPCDKLK